MSDPTTTALVTSLVQEASKAHHEAFASVDGHDPEWAAWYAEFTIGELTSLVGRDVVAEDLAEWLAEFEESRRTEAPDTDWARYYAEQIVLRLAGSSTP